MISGISQGVGGWRSRELITIIIWPHSAIKGHLAVLLYGCSAVWLNARTAMHPMAKFGKGIYSEATLTNVP